MISQSSVSSSAPMHDATPPAGESVLILGATYVTGNMGVDALLSGTVASVLHATPRARILLLDYGKQPGGFVVPAPQGHAVLELVNLRFSWKLWLPNNAFRLLASALLLRALPERWRQRSIQSNPWLREIAGARLCLSLAGGDSFSDIYGLRRLIYIALPKLLVLALQRPLVLLPQTIGPFKSTAARGLGRFLMRHARLVYSRDEEGLEVARELVGEDASHLRYSPDMAFALAPRAPARLPEWLQQRNPSTPLVGLNVSGLLQMGGYTGRNMFELGIDYPRLTAALVRWFTQEAGAEVVLISHVTGKQAGAEDDAPACARLFEELQAECGGRLHVAEPTYNHREIKYLIGHCDFFLGSRMHATIAALSQGVPAIGLAYSRKFVGVFHSVGAADLVVDLRRGTVEEALEGVKTAFAERERHRRRLEGTTQRAARAALGLVSELLREKPPGASAPEMPRRRSRPLGATPQPQVNGATS